MSVVWIESVGRRGEFSKKGNVRDEASKPTRSVLCLWHNKKMGLLHELNSKKILKKRRNFGQTREVFYYTKVVPHISPLPLSPPPLGLMLRTVMPRACVLGDYATKVKKRKKKSCVCSNWRGENPAKTWHLELGGSCNQKKGQDGAGELVFLGNARWKRTGKQLLLLLLLTLGTRAWILVAPGKWVIEQQVSVLNWCSRRRAAPPKWTVCVLWSLWRFTSETGLSICFEVCIARSSNSGLRTHQQFGVGH